MLSIILLYLSTLHVSLCVVNNVCKSYEDYSTIQQNRNCWHNPTVGSDLEEIITGNGYPFETYQLTTQDGYILTLVRIPHNGKNKTSKRTPVVLQHGLGGDGRSWFLEDEPPALLLSNHGFDVWIMNLRGTKYSSKHRHFGVDAEKLFWNFSFHEISVIDIPLIIEFIAKKTGRKGEIVYIGHSLGTTSSYIYASLKPEHAKENVRRIISLAPSAYLKSVKGFQKSLFLIASPLLQILPKFGIYGIGRNTEEWLTILKIACSTYPIVLLCSLILNLSLGVNPNNVKPETIPLYTQNSVSGFSAKTMLHYWQIILARGRFQWFDYGAANNLQVYNSTIPPEYDVAKINVPVHLFSGKDDHLVLEEGVLLLYGKLKTEKTLMSDLPGGKFINHVDYIMGDYVKQFYEMLSCFINENFSSHGTDKCINVKQS